MQTEKYVYTTLKSICLMVDRNLKTIDLTACDTLQVWNKTSPEKLA